MANNKTNFTEQSVDDFIENLENKQQQADSISLIKLMSKVSGERPQMYGPTIVGFGKYHYQYDSGHKGEAPLIGFSPRKAAISLYILTDVAQQQHLLENLGKYKIGKACIYIKKTADINEEVLKKIMTTSIELIRKRYKTIKE